MNRRFVTKRALPLLLACAALTLLVACSQEPAADRLGPAPRSALPPETIATLNPQPPLAPSGDGFLRELGEARIPQSAAAATIRPLALGDVETLLQVLVIGATTTDNPSYEAWLALLAQTGTPYETLIASEERLTPERLVTPSGVGRFQAILLATGDLALNVAGPEAEPEYVSQFDEGEWALLHEYERAFGVRQVALYAFPGAQPESYGAKPASEEAEGRKLDGVLIQPTAAGAALFTALAPEAQIELTGTYGFPSVLIDDQDPTTVPLLEDAEGNVMAVTSAAPDGRERVALFFDNAAWNGVPTIFTQALGPDLLRWATRGLYIGERRNSFTADIDDWFFTSDYWDTETGGLSDERFELSAADAWSFAQQQADLRAEFAGIADDFTWTMAFNGSEADPDAAVDCDLEPSEHTLSSITKCLAGEFWWVNHTWSHRYMDRNQGAGYDIGYEEIRDEIDLNDAIVDAFGFGPTYSPRSLVTGDVSGLGWFSPGWPDTQPKVDHGLEHSNPDLLAATVDTGRRYLAANMSTRSHEPDCWACGIRHPLNEDVFLVPRWPTNLFVSITNPEAMVQAYNLVYGPEGNKEFPEGVDYDRYLDIESDIAVRHLMSGSPYPHYFHIANLHEYEAGKSVLTDWTRALLAKYAALIDLPLVTLPWDEYGAYVEQRTEFVNSGLSGSWNRTTGEVTILSQKGGTGFLTGASLGVGADDFSYGGQLISRREFAAGESVTLAYGGQVGEIDRYQLAVTAEGRGTVAGGGAYPAFTTASLTATPDEGFRLVEWTGALSGRANPASLVMTGDLSVTAHFAEKLAQAITFRALPDRLTVDAPFELTATSDSALPVTFSATGVCAVAGSLVTLNGDAGECVVTAHQAGDDDYFPAQAVSRSFAVVPGRALTIRVHGSGYGLLVVTPSGEACIDSCVVSVGEGAVVTLTPVALFGSGFDGFSGACEGGSCSFVMDRDREVGARFSLGD